MAFKLINELAEHGNFEGLCQMAVNEGFELKHMNSLIVPTPHPGFGASSNVRLIAVFFRPNK